jgi:hypothetical protein
MGGINQSQFLEVRHDIPDRRGAQINTGIPGKGARPNRLTIANIALNQHFQKMLGSLINIQWGNFLSAHSITGYSSKYGTQT